MNRPLGWDLPRERYERDPVFHQLVDVMRHMLEENGDRLWTPTELREAVMLAAVMYEQTHIRPLLVSKDDYIQMQEAADRIIADIRELNQ